MASELGLESCNLCCQLADVLFCRHAGELAWGLQGLSFLLLSGRIQGREHTQHPGACGAPMYLQGVTQGEWIPAECLGRNFIASKLGYVHGGTLPVQKLT